MSTTVFDDIVASGELSYDAASADVIARSLSGRVRRRRAVHAASAGGVALAACGVVAAGVVASNGAIAPAASPSPALDPATVPLVSGTTGSNLLGPCEGDGKSVAELIGRDYSDHNVSPGAYRVVMRHANCSLASVDGGDLIDVRVDVTLDAGSPPVTAILHSTVTNTSDDTLAFDMASPTLTLTVPKPFPQSFDSMFHELPVFGLEGRTRPEGVEGQGGITFGTDGVSSQSTPVLIGGPQAGDAESLALQRDFEGTWFVPDSGAKVWLAPGESFEVESRLNLTMYGTDPVYGPDVPVTDAHIEALFSGDTSGLDPRFSLSLFSPDGTTRTLLVDNDVRLKVEH